MYFIVLAREQINDMRTITNTCDFCGKEETETYYAGSVVKKPMTIVDSLWSCRDCVWLAFKLLLEKKLKCAVSVRQ